MQESWRKWGVIILGIVTASVLSLWVPVDLVAEFREQGSTPQRTLPLILSQGGKVNVLDFGAVPDDGQEDSAAIATAIAFARSEVYIPTGRYLVNDGIYVNQKSLLVIRGDGPGTVLEQTQRGPNGYMIFLENSEHVTLRDFMMDGELTNGAFSDGIVIMHSNRYMAVRDVRATELYNAAVYAQAPNTVIDGLVAWNLGQAVVLAGPYSVIKNGDFRDVASPVGTLPGERGGVVEVKAEAHHSRLESNYIQQNNVAMSVEAVDWSTPDSVIHGNTVVVKAEAGAIILGSRARGVVVSANTVEGGTAGILVMRSENIVEGNTVRGSGSGISVSTYGPTWGPELCGGVIVTGNVLVANEEGVRVYYCDGEVYVVENVFSANLSEKVAIYQAPNVIVRDNIYR